MVYANKIEIFSILKSDQKNLTTIDIITLGGKYKDRNESYSHVLHLGKGDLGIFFLEPSSTKNNTYKVIGGDGGYFRESRFEDVYFSSTRIFQSKNELKNEIFAYTKENEKRIVNRGCLTLAIEFVNSIDQNILKFRISAGSQIPSTLLKSLLIPVTYDPDEFNIDPFDSGILDLNLSSELADNYELDESRMDVDKIFYTIEKSITGSPILLGNQFTPILEGDLDISQLSVAGVPHLDILEDYLLEYSKYTLSDAENSPESMWSCMNFDQNVFQEFIPRIDSITPLNVAAGVGAVSENGIPGEITIYGSGFGTPLPGSTSAGTVGFLDAETITEALPLVPLGFTYPAQLDYIFWSDTLIKVRVPSRGDNMASDADQGVATSGIIEVSVSGSSTQSSQQLYVHFGMFNDYFEDSSGMIGSQRRRMSAKWRDLNPSIEGYRLMVDQSVLDSIPGAFDMIEEAADEWRCNLDHPIWIKIDTMPTGLYTGFITMDPTVTSSLAAVTGVVSSNQPCTVSVSNEIRIRLNSNFTFINSPIASNPDTVHFKKVMVHEFGHAFLARHTVNRSIMYPNGFFANISTLSSDDNLCGQHTYTLGATGPPCEPSPAQLFNLNIGEFICGTTSVENTVKTIKMFEVYPNPGNDVLKIKTLSDKLAKEDVKADIVDITGKIVGKISNINDEYNIQRFNSGIYFIRFYNLENTLIDVQKYLINE